MSRPLKFLSRGLFVFALLVPAAILTSAPVAAATIAPTTTCSNGVDNTGGLGLICQVTVVNTITGTGGSATVTVYECHGAAGNPTAACTTTTTSLAGPVTAVTQCNNSINGGGGTLRCSVAVTDNFYSLSPGSTSASVNQCIGSGGGVTTGCNPFPANTTGAAITQCNGSANGGTLVGLTCTATGTMASTHGVTINQCNGSANGGGALVICSASLVNNAVSGTPPPGASGASPGAPGASGTPPPTSTTVNGGSSSGPTPLFGLMILVALSGFALAAVLTQRRSIRR
ncbi:MAG: hypothetical protein ACHQ01_08600 [Candidatus Limnocylindrales bacterium]